MRSATSRTRPICAGLKKQLTLLDLLSPHSPFSLPTANCHSSLITMAISWVDRGKGREEGGVESPSIKSQGFAARNQKPNFSSTLTVFKSRTPSDLLDRALFPNPFGEEATFLV